jgi:hypothetical protein
LWLKVAIDTSVSHSPFGNNTNAGVEIARFALAVNALVIESPGGLVQRRSSGSGVTREQVTSVKVIASGIEHWIIRIS